MLVLDIRSDVDKAVRALSQLQRTIIPVATARALNKTGSQTKTEASRLIRQTYNLPARTIARQISVTKASRTTLTAIVKPSGRKLPVLSFSARQTAAGVRVHIKRGSPRVIAHAFIARTRSGHVGVFARGRYSGRSFVHQKSRLPITELFTVGVPQAFGNRVVIQALRTKIAQTFPRVMEHEIRYAISRL